MGRGIPVKTAYPPLPVFVLYIILFGGYVLIGLPIAWQIHQRGNTAKYERVTELVGSYDLGYLYAAAVVLKVGYIIIITNLGTARKASKVNVPDQQVYKVYTPPGSAQMGYVLMETEGNLGKFNRAQRAFQTYVEQAPLVFLFFMLAGLVYPFPVFVLVCLYTFCRVVMAIGYTRQPNGRVAGNSLSKICIGVAEGFVLMIAYQTLK